MNKKLSKQEVRKILTEHVCTGQYSGKEKKWFINKYAPINEKEKEKQNELPSVLQHFGVQYEFNH